MSASGTQRLGDRVVDIVLATGRAIGAVGRPLRRPLDRLWNALTRALRIRADVLTKPSAVGMRRLAVAGLLANGFIVVSGGLVRLTKSGLGCPTWPRCTPDSLLPAAHTDVPAMQMAIEFGNRMLTFVLLAVGVLVFVAAVHLRDERPDLARLAVVQPLGILAQGVLGGVTVLSGLHPAVVGAHYLLSAVVLIACVVLVVRAGEGDGPPIDGRRAAHHPSGEGCCRTPGSCCSRPAPSSPAPGRTPATRRRRALRISRRRHRRRWPRASTRWRCGRPSRWWSVCSS